MPHLDTKMKLSPWIEGIADAIGFLVGALLGFGVGSVLDFDVFSPGYETTTIIGIVLVGIGGGVGLQLARKWRTAQGR